MKFSFGINGDHIFFQKYEKLMSEISKDILSFYKTKSYSSMVDYIMIDFWWDWKGPFLIRLHSKPWYIEDKHPKLLPRHKDSPTFHIYHHLMAEIRLPESFIDSNDQEAVIQVKEILINYFTNTALPVKIRKSFDKDRFIADLRQFFDTFIEQRGWEQDGKKEEPREWYRTVQEPDGTIK